jgi:hypothetical protein
MRARIYIQPFVPVTADVSYPKFVWKSLVTSCSAAARLVYRDQRLSVSHNDSSHHLSPSGPFPTLLPLPLLPTSSQRRDATAYPARRFQGLDLAAALAFGFSSFDPTTQLFSHRRHEK